jgi:hypothetical protein
VGPHARRMVGPISPLSIILTQSWIPRTCLDLKPTIYTPLLAISRGDGGETRNTQYRSTDCEDRRGDAAGATLGCPF